MSKIMITISIVLSLIGLFGCDVKQVKADYYFKPYEANKEMKIMVSSDLHYLSKQLIEEDSPICKPNYYGDGRIVVYIEELVDAFINEVLMYKPDCLILTGDLNFNGALINHQDLASKLDKLVKNGIRVLVSPGNHDLDTTNSVKYTKDGNMKVTNTKSSNFRKIYANEGYGNATFYDKTSLSYACQLSDDLIVLMLDTCIYNDKDPYKSLISGKINDETLNFIEEVLRYAKENKMDVISTSHHNLLVHNDLFIGNYQMVNYDKILSLYNKYCVKLNLSGHMHIQHIIENEVIEILSSSLAIYNNQYGIIDYIPHKKIIYKTKIVDVSDYAKQKQINNNDLLNFEDYAYNFFKKSSYDKTFENVMFNDSSLNELAEALATAQAILNPAYFSGNVKDVLETLEKDPSYKIWNKEENRYYTKYINSMIISGNSDHCEITIELEDKK